MSEKREKILADIDTTLDQLITNANTITEISANGLFEHEREALQKTQESLLARLIHQQSLLDQKESSAIPSLDKGDSKLAEPGKKKRTAKPIVRKHRKRDRVLTFLKCRFFN